LIPATTTEGASAPSNLAFALAICALVVACRHSQTLTLHDTEGRAFTAIVRDNEVTQVKLSHLPDSSNPFELRRAGHLIAACPAPDASKSPMTHCRALVCKADADCPPAHGLKQGTCINALCIEPSRDIVADDAVLLCLAGTGADYASPLQVERFALGLNCGHPCRVPSPCRQP